LYDEPGFVGDIRSPFFIGDDDDFGPLIRTPFGITIPSDNLVDRGRASSLRIEQIDYGESIRIGTYNVQFLATEFTDDGCCEDIPGRVRKLAERILAADYDIIVLNEAFIDEIQDGLRDILREYYPHHIKKLDAIGQTKICHTRLSSMRETLMIVVGLMF
jgi:hypothetical protein